MSCRIVSRLLLPLTLLSAILAVGSCCPPFCSQPGSGGDPCGLSISTRNSADDALSETVIRSGVSSGSTHNDQFLARDGTVSNSQPEDVIGFAFKTSMGAGGSSGGTLPPLAFFGHYFVLQYDIPARPCPSRVDWIIRPEVVFPTGYVFLPKPDSGALRVFLWTFADPQGVIDLSSNRTEALNFVQAKFTEAWEGDEGHRWTAKETSAGAVFVSHRLEGNYVVAAGVRSRVFVAADIELWLSPGEKACIGCLDNRPLLDSGIFRGLAPGASARDKGLFGPDLVINRVR